MDEMARAVQACRSAPLVEAIAEDTVGRGEGSSLSLADRLTWLLVCVAGREGSGAAVLHFDHTIRAKRLTAGNRLV